MTFAAVTNETLGWTIFIVIVVGVITYTVINIVRGAKPELGSEIELAANRKPYLDDEELEGKKLDRALTWGLVTLLIIAVGLPMYWIYEPGRQANAELHQAIQAQGVRAQISTASADQAADGQAAHERREHGADRVNGDAEGQSHRTTELRSSRSRREDHLHRAELRLARVHARTAHAEVERALVQQWPEVPSAREEFGVCDAKRIEPIGCGACRL